MVKERKLIKHELIAETADRLIAWYGGTTSRQSATRFCRERQPTFDNEAHGSRRVQRPTTDDY